MLKTPERPAGRRPIVLVLAAAALTLGFGGALAAADEPLATTPSDTTPAITTPTTPAPTLYGAASSAAIGWTLPAGMLEDTKFSVALNGTINGQATGHLALVDPAGACPASPVYPRQLATGTKLTVADTAEPGVGTVAQTLTLTEKDSGTFRLCGWVVGSPASSEASTVAKVDQVVSVGNKTATLGVETPTTARSADYFTVKLTGHTAGAGRRALIMAAPNTGQSCERMRKAPSGRLPLQTVVGIASGDFTKTLRLRYRSKTAGDYLFCVQVVEATDRNPEAQWSVPMAVSESLKCTGTQAALAQRHADLKVIRERRDSTLSRLTASKKKATPMKKAMSHQRAISNNRIASARKAVSRAKSAKGKQKARRHLAAVKRSETRRLSRVGKPLRKLNVTIRAQERAYKQYRSGASLLNDTITRTSKDLKKYCAKG